MSNNSLPDKEANNSDKVAMLHAMTGKSNSLRMFEQTKGCRNIDDVKEVKKK